jgi:hypothetical protein
MKIFNKNTENVLKLLSKMDWVKNFYLAGGTGLALQIFHRKSLDFDFFSYKNKLYFVDREEIKTEFKKFSKIIILQDKDGTLEVVFNNIKISLFYYNSLLVKPLKKLYNINIASMEDIGLMKLATIISRGSKKDFIDLYFICKEIELKKLLSLSKKKFSEVYNFELLVAKSLTYFIDAEREKMPIMIKKVSWEEVKKFFIKEAKNVIQ